MLCILDPPSTMSSKLCMKSASQFQPPVSFQPTTGSRRQANHETMNTAVPSMTSIDHAGSRRRGILLVAGSAIVWSFGGAIARFLEVDDSWTIVFWRSLGRPRGRCPVA